MFHSQAIFAQSFLVMTRRSRLYFAPM